MVKNYIFDFGNVLAKFDPFKLTEPYVLDKEKVKYISEVVFDRLYWNKLDDGTITDEELKKEVRKRLPEELGDVACRVYDNWINTLTPVEGMHELISDMHKQGRKIYLISNISKGFADYYSRVPWIKEMFDCFEDLVFSGVLGMIKPDKEIFEYLLKKHNLKPAESIFIDDSEKNINGAVAVGIEGYLFDGDVKKLRNYLDM